jgi:hypothetical protein
LSPLFIRSFSLISLGMAICPFWDTVAAFMVPPP